MTPEPSETPLVLCPHCHQPLTNVGWLVNSEAGLVTFYHNVPTCGRALNCQFVPVEQKRIQLPNELRPRGLG